MRKPLILNTLKKYSENSTSRFHMPGHKGISPAGKACKELYSVSPYDITELSFSGCLETDEGIIKKAEKNVAEILSAKKTYFVTDGSSAAILAAVYTVSKRGKKVIIQRNSHKSIYNGISLFGLNPIFLSDKTENGLYYPDIDVLDKLLTDNKDVSGVIITSPDYYGIVPNLQKVAEITQKHGVLFVVDGAHGSHLKFSQPDLYAGNYADIWIDGVHKTLPCYTQCSLLNVNDQNCIADAAQGLSLFRTTSPSYVLMASIEYGEYYAEAYGNKKYSSLFKNIKALTDETEKSGIYFLKTSDKTKLVIDCDLSKINAENLNAYLESKNVFAEMCDGRYIVFMLSLMTRNSDLIKLKNLLQQYVNNVKVPFITHNSFKANNNEQVVDYYTAKNSPSELISLSKSIGRIAAENVGIFPPCYPYVIAGEIITENAINSLNKSKNVFGTENGLIKVIKEKQ